MQKKVRTNLTDLFLLVVASAIYGISINIFAIPNDLVQGGITGIAIIFNHIFPIIPTGAYSLIFNIPLFILAWKFIGGRFIVKSFIATILVSVSIDIFSFLPQYKGDLILVSLFGGVMSGISLAVVFIRGATTGGTDILAKLIRLKRPDISMGRVILYFDFLVIILFTIVYRNPENAMYSLVLIFVSTYCIDYFLYGSSHAKAILIITEKADEISNEISSELGRGSTEIKSTGKYTNKDKELLICAVRINEVERVKKIIRLTDNKAFSIICDASEIVGLGFNAK